MKKKLLNEANNKANKLLQESSLSKHKKMTISEKEASITTTEKQVPILYETPTTFFSNRLSNAFPNVRGLKWFNNPQEAVERFKLLLKEPKISLYESILLYKLYRLIIEHDV